jgi:hypothetical protein
MTGEGFTGMFDHCDHPDTRSIASEMSKMRSITINQIHFADSTETCDVPCACAASLMDFTTKSFDEGLDSVKESLGILWKKRQQNCSI